MAMIPPPIGPGSTRQTVGSGFETRTPRLARVSRVISMCGRDGRCSPSWRKVRPCSNLGALSSSPETNWLEALASITSSPPTTEPLPLRVNGSEPVAASSTSTPSARSEEMVVCIGRLRAAASPSKVTSPVARVAIGGTKRITVPARPQLMVAGPSSGFGETSRSPLLFWSMRVPSERSASIISAESRECSGEVRRVWSAARALRTSSRLVSDFEPGSGTVACSGAAATGAGQSGCSLCWE